jgi:hypothetical protein
MTRKCSRQRQLTHREQKKSMMPNRKKNKKEKNLKNIDNIRQTKKNNP